MNINEKIEICVAIATQTFTIWHEKEKGEKSQKCQKHTQKFTKKLPYLLLFYLFKWKKEEKNTHVNNY